MHAARDRLERCTLAHTCCKCSLLVDGTWRTRRRSDSGINRWDETNWCGAVGYIRAQLLFTTMACNTGGNGSKGRIAGATKPRELTTANMLPKRAYQHTSSRHVMSHVTSLTSEVAVTVECERSKPRVSFRLSLASPTIVWDTSPTTDPCFRSLLRTDSHALRNIPPSW